MNEQEHAQPESGEPRSAGAARDDTDELIQRARSGDSNALRELLQRHRSAVLAAAFERFCSTLGDLDTEHGVVNSVVSEVLRAAPRLPFENAGQFHALIAHAILSKVAWMAAGCGDSHHVHDRHLPGEQVNPTTFDPLHARRLLVHFARQLVDFESQMLLRLRLDQDLDFATIGRRLRITPAAARRHFHRAVDRVARQILRVRSGQLNAILVDLEDARLRCGPSSQKTPQGRYP